MINIKNTLLSNLSTILSEISMCQLAESHRKATRVLFATKICLLKLNITHGTIEGTGVGLSSAFLSQIDLTFLKPLSFWYQHLARVSMLLKIVQQCLIIHVLSEFLNDYYLLEDT